MNIIYRLDQCFLIFKLENFNEIQINLKIILKSKFPEYIIIILKIIYFYLKKKCLKNIIEYKNIYNINILIHIFQI